MKTVSLTDEAAARLEAWRSSPDESLSDVILRKMEVPPSSAVAPADSSSTQLLGSLEGVMHFGPGWEDPLPLEDWDALKEA